MGFGKISSTGWFILLVLSLALLGCGTGGSYSGGSNPTSNPTMQSGQWEFVFAPTSGAKPVYLETNLVSSFGAVSSTVLNTILFQFGGQVGGQFSEILGFDVYASVKDVTLGGMGHTSAAMTARYTGEIPLDQVRAEFSSRFGNKIDVLENKENLENKAAA